MHARAAFIELLHCAGPIRSAYENGAEMPTGKSDRKAAPGLAIILDSSIGPHLVVKWQATAREPQITERRERLFGLFEGRRLINRLIPELCKISAKHSPS